MTVLYHHYFVQDHVFSRGERQDLGHVRTHVVSVDLEYGLTDRLSLRALLPYVAAKYTGPHPHQRGGTLSDVRQTDDGTYHPAFQDFRLEARYGASEFPVAIAPFVAVSLPTHDYEFFAHSGVGLKMAELQVGAYAGKLAGPFSFSGRVSHGIYERVAGRRRQRSNIDAEIGWSAARNVRLFAYQLAQVSHGGVELRLEEFLNRTISANDWWPHHDQLGRANFLNLGGGASIRVTPSVAVHGFVVATAAGANTHAAKYGITVGATWGFGRLRPHHGRPVQRP